VWSALVVPVPALALSLVLDGPRAVGSALAGLGPEALVSTLYTAGLASLVGYSIFNALLSRYPASSVVPFALIAPPVAMAAAWLLLDQVPNAAESSGGIIVLVGVLVTVWQRQSGPARDEAERPGRATADVPDVDEARVRELRGEPVLVAVRDAPTVEDHPEHRPVPGLRAARVGAQGGFVAEQRCLGDAAGAQ